MKVKLHPFRKGLCYGNILWSPAFPMRGGKFPPNHPVGGGFCDAGSSQTSNTESIKAFREMGYWASCFPEGDGITWQPLKDQSVEQTQKDIESAFGWTVELAKESK